MSRRLIGKPVFMRTVTNFYTGNLKDVTDDGFYVLEGAAWVAVTGRFGTMQASGLDIQGAEVEPYPIEILVYVNTAATVDIQEWTHTLPREQTSS